LEDLQQGNAQFIADCQADGLTIIHFDLVSVEYVIPVGARDYTVFNKHAVDIVPYIAQAILDGEISVDGEERSPIQVILETIFGVEVFGDDVNEDYALRVLLEILEFLREIDPTGDCLPTPLTVNHFFGLAGHTSSFRGNIDLLPKIFVSSHPTGDVTITVSPLVVDAADDIMADVLAGIEKWNVCRIAPDGTEFRFIVNAREATSADRISQNVDVNVTKKVGIDCRDSAQ